MPPRQTILVVEDEQSIAETITYALQTEGFATLWKTTGREALVAFGAQPVALVVLDVGLPDMSGFDVCREMQKRGAPPVILMYNTISGSEILRSKYGITVCVTFLPETFLMMPARFFSV